MPERLLSDWPAPDALSKHKAAVERLLQLRLLVHAAGSGTGSSGAAAVAVAGSAQAAGQQGKAKR